MNTVAEAHPVYDRKVDSARQYWMRALSTGCEDAIIPIERSRRTQMSVEGSIVLTISGEQFTRLTKLTNESVFLLYVCLLAAVKACLYKYSRSDVITVGGPPRGVDCESFEPSDVLAIVDQIDREMPFRSLLLNIKKTVVEAYQYQDYPLSEFVDIWAEGEERQFRPQVLVAVKDFHGDHPYLTGDIILRFEKCVAGVIGTVNFDSSLFHQDVIQRFLSDFLGILNLALQDITISIKDLSALTDVERQQLILEWNDTDRPFPQHRCVDELFVSQAHNTPDAVAAVYDDQQLTYLELNRRANQLARHLNAIGVKLEERIALCLERSLEMLVSILGVLKAGGVYVPMDPSYPPERLRHMLNDSKATLLLTQRTFPNHLPLVTARTVCLDHDWERISEQSESEPGNHVVAENLAYVIYTSGSTGKPKGVGVSHRNLLSSTWARRNVYHKRPDRYLLLSPFSFDSSVAGIFWTLLEGGTLVLPAKNAQQDPLQIAKIIVRSQISHMLLLPSLYRYIIEAADPGQTTSLRVVIVAGEACPANLIRLHLSTTSNANLFNEYGPTEGTVWSAVYLCSVELSEVTIPIGKPITNSSAYVADLAGELVPRGIAGELYLGGSGVARGYINQSGATAERFAPDRFSRHAGERMYRTGDLVRWREDGELEFLGRVDQQVKIRGYRIEPGEIEARLGEHEAVGAAAVIAREEGDERRLVAYVVMKDGEEGRVSELREYLKERLPEYMTPWAYVRLERLPLTPNGKVDKKALPQPQVGGREQEEGYRKPRTEIGEVMAGIWRQVLRVEKVGAEDNFFDLGGHSLLATRVVSRIREVLKVEVPLKTIFEEKTLAGLSRRVEAELRAGAVIQIPPIERVSREGRLPLSFAQQRLWFIDQLEPGGAMYNIPSALRLRGELRLELLEQTLSEVVRRHEVLRTRIEVRDGQPAQVIEEASPVWMPVIDVSGLDERQREQEARRITGEEAARGFDLGRGPLLRAGILRLGEQDQALLVTMHHVVSDEWSRGALVKEVNSLYAAYSKGESSPLEELPIQYADFAVWQRGWLQGAMLDRQIGYWREQLQGVETLETPTDYPRPVIQSYEGAGEWALIPEETAQKLRHLAWQEGATMFMLLQSAFKILLHRYSGQERIVVGTPIAGRNHLELEPLIGFFVNMLAIKTDLSAEPSVREAIARERGAALGAYTHQDVPFEKVVEELQPERDMGRHPIFQVIFVYERAAEERAAAENLRLSGFGAGIPQAKYDLRLTVVEGARGLTASVVYCAALFDATRARRMLWHLGTLLERMTEDAEQKIGEIEILSEGERGQLLYEWNDTQAGCPGEKLIHKLFEEQAESAPDAIAAVCEGEQLSYRELNQRANQLARHLQGLGIKAEALVAICVERSLEMVIAALGTLKSGGAYAPLDPRYPVKWIESVMDEAQPSVLLTQTRLLPHLPLCRAQVLCLDEDWRRIGSQSQEAPGSSVSAENLAYTIYTSGSTGKPKGVMDSHRAVSNHLLWRQARYPLTSQDAFLQKASLSFDISVWEIFGTLLAGARLVLARLGSEGDSLDLVRMVKDYEISVIHFGPAMLRAFLSEDVKECKTLRHVYCGGESLTPDLQARFFSDLKAELHHQYGPTETSIDVTVWDCEREGERSAIPIGHPIWNMQIYALDQKQEPVAIGVTGELWIGGVGLARGYLNRPELTAEKFRPEGLRGLSGNRLYQTGDLARLRSDGAVEFIGRNDRQVKVRGYRIELGEIEARLGGHEAVAEAAVIVREEGGEKRLVAYVVMRDGEENRVSELREYLKERLPEYMAPATYVKLERMPLTANGKVDKKALPQPKVVGNGQEESYREPRTEVEEVMAGIWSQVLKIDRVGIDDNFFELGGDSILSIQVVSRANQAGIKIAPKQMFQHQTIAELAEVAAKAVEFKAEQSRVEGIVPLTPIQQSFFERDAPNRDHSNQSVMLRINQSIKPDTMRVVVHRLVEQHDALRMRYKQKEKGWEQRNAAAEDNEIFSQIDLSSVEEGRYAELINSSAGQAQRGLSLSDGPLLRVAHYQGKEGTERLLIVIHRLVVDSVSWRILLEDLQRGCEQVVKGEPIDFGKKTTSFKRWAEKLRGYANSEELRAELSYWENMPEVEENRIRIDEPGWRHTATGRRTTSQRLSREQTTALIQEIGKVYRTQVNDLLLTGLARAVGRWRKKGRLVVEMAEHGREELFEGVDVSRTVGWFTTIYPVEIDLEGEEKIGEQVKRVKEQLRKAPRKGIGYGLLRYLREGQAGQGLRNKRGEIRYNYLGQFDQALEGEERLSFAKESQGEDVSEQMEIDDLLEINIGVIAGRLEIAMVYSEEAHTGEKVEKLARYYREALEEIIEHCMSDDSGGYTPSDFPDSGLTQNTLDQLIEEINRMYD